MSSIWKAVTGLFKSKDMEDREDDGSEEDSDDSEDEDFVPANEANNDLSEEDEEVNDGETPAKPKTKSTTGKGIGKGGARRSKNAKKRKLGKAAGRSGKRGKFEDEEDSDDNEDVDFVVNESLLKEGEKEDQQIQEQSSAEDALEKKHTDMLWADFLTSVEKEKSNKGKERTVEKVVSKVYDFAGEKVEVQEKVRVTVDESKATSSSPSTSSASSSTINLQEDSTTATDESAEQPGPSTSAAAANGAAQKAKPNQPRRGGISILGNDPEAIGLDELEKRGLTGLLKAFQSKTKKIGTLEKSKLDWEEYKRKTGLEDELHNHNRSRDTFIDKQEFLQRTDYRQFEIEKGMRATARSRRLAN
ncbi:unnamed protein product [Orchesella dallaii]|uniref:Craniofacial development protein 1 n=1 Tax=Orchesella dallaii TaxID=48710 RepID=A0ABP1RQM0_9HEXA